MTTPPSFWAFSSSSATWTAYQKVRMRLNEVQS
eukprot:CAMPEP_0194402294 /NCGR_PEP_ID=MMETSP0176-20130528/977_1 /TAXON_ID=216777 /ORGANISM="Proboscia alata, Strain PI-D3" /LENGTH=32 /DNA_ID= /DNA_START= /DNA_END= /DNA_ORIENTATION=